jgi:opacity protein-like surface antigen
MNHPSWLVAPVAAALALGAMIFGATSAKAEDPGGGWQLEVTPYLFGAGLDGTVGVRSVEGELDADFDEILDNLDSAFMGTVELRRGRFGLLLDGLYFKLADEETSSWQGPGGVGSATGELEATTTMQLYQIGLGYRVGERVAVDLIAGARYTKLDADLDLTVTTGGLLPGGARSVSDDQSWWDPVIGARVLIPIGERWTAVLYGDFGGFGVGSDSTYQLIAGLNWQFAKHFSVKAGYRYLYQDYEDDDEGFKWDMAAQGPYLGLGIRF